MVDDVPEQQHEPREHARLYAAGDPNGRRVVDHGLDLPGQGIQVPNDSMFLLAKSIVTRSQ